MRYKKIWQTVYWELANEKAALKTKRPFTEADAARLKALSDVLGRMNYLEDEEKEKDLKNRW